MLLKLKHGNRSALSWGRANSDPDTVLPWAFYCITALPDLSRALLKSAGWRISRLGSCSICLLLSSFFSLYPSPNLFINIVFGHLQAPDITPSIGETEMENTMWQLLPQQRGNQVNMERETGTKKENQEVDVRALWAYLLETNRSEPTFLKK